MTGQLRPLLVQLRLLLVAAPGQAPHLVEEPELLVGQCRRRGQVPGSAAAAARRGVITRGGAAAYTHGPGVESCKCNS